MKKGQSQRWLAESRWTADEALAWAEWLYSNSRRWPDRRYRIETPGLGNSRMLTEGRANQDRARYGGRVVELIPSRSAYCEAHGVVRMSKFEMEAREYGECPRCKVPPGAACREPAGDKRSPHRVRVVVTPPATDPPVHRQGGWPIAAAIAIVAAPALDTTTALERAKKRRRAKVSS